MNENQSKFTLNGRSPFYQLLVSLMIIMVAGVFLLYLLLWISTLISGTEWPALIESISLESGDKNVAVLRLVIMSQDIALFIVPGILILTLFKLSLDEDHTLFKLPYLNEVAFVVILGFCIFPITSFTGQINSAMHLPEWLSGVETWMVQKEDQANYLIDQVLPSANFGILMLNICVIAVLPALGEELIFRGVFQKILTDLFKSGHLAIWVTAFIFSALHFQFFGFIPRFILGLIFGYLFFWSGTIWLPVISHFVNNAFPVILTYTKGLEKVNTQPDFPLWQQAIFLPLPIIISLVILFYFRNNKNKNQVSGSNLINSLK